MSLDPAAFLPLTPAVFEILLALAEQDLHGYAIMQAVETRSAGAVKLLPGTLYRALDRLLDSGLVKEKPSKSSADDPRRRYYRLTPLGRRVLSAEAKRLEEQVRAAQRLDILEAK
ncbi:MAG: helix-turn-helix transcriptional regulator [Acidobacteria bacterium]|nr:helix-turn-helix transcriptional regulator [Acidobacteriota bacterium]